MGSDPGQLHLQYLACARDLGARMSGASKTNSPLVLYAEGVDPEADLVLVCGDIKFFVRRAVCELAFPVLEAMPDKSSDAEFDVLGQDSATLLKLLSLVDPRGAIALTPKLIAEVSPLAHFLGADALIQSFYAFLVQNHELKSFVATAAFRVDKLLGKEPKWPDRILTAMVRFILPRDWASSGKKLEVITDHVKGLHASTTVALFQHVARKFFKAACYDLQEQEIGKVVEYALHEQEYE